MKYSYSSNGEEFRGLCDSIEDAIAEGCDDDDMAEFIYVGEATSKTIGDYLWLGDVEKLLEQLSEQASEECGECAEGWLQFDTFPYIRGESPAERSQRHKLHREKTAARLEPLVKGIKAALEQWATDEGLQPGFWHVDNVKSYDRAGNHLAE